MSIRVYKGTPAEHGKSLCDTCAYNRRRKGETEGGEQVECSVFPERLEKTRPRIITECTEYYEKGRASIRDMREIAWILDLDEKKNYGFVKAEQWKKKYGQEVKIPEVDF